MKRVLILILVLVLINTMANAGFDDGGLSFDVKGISIKTEWNDEISDTNKWILIEGELTNWETESLEIDKNLSAELVFQDKYIFEGAPEFMCDIIDPLVVLKGGLLFFVPNMVADAGVEMMHVTISIQGQDIEISPDIVTTNYNDVTRFECGGFGTPEEAVKAYIDAFNRGDVQNMLSTFAIETYIDNVNTEAYINRLRAVGMTMPLSMPIANEYIRMIEIALRYGDLAKLVFYQYTLCNVPETYKEITEGALFKLNEEISSVDFIRAMSDVPMEKWFNNIEFKRYINPEDMSELYLGDNNKNYMQNSQTTYGCDEIEDVAALIEVDGMEYILMLQCARYGEKWYNFAFGGSLAQLLGVDAYRAGLVAFDALI